MLSTIIRILLALIVLRLAYGWFIRPLLAGRRPKPPPPPKKPRLKKRMDLTGLDVEDATFKDVDRKP